MMALLQPQNTFVVCTFLCKLKRAYLRFHLRYTLQSNRIYSSLKLVCISKFVWKEKMPRNK